MLKDDILNENRTFRLFYILERENKLKFYSVRNFFCTEIEEISDQMLHKRLEALHELGIVKIVHHKNDYEEYSINWHGVSHHIFTKHFGFQGKKEYEKEMVDKMKHHVMSYVHLHKKDLITLHDAFEDAKQSTHAHHNLNKLLKINADRKKK